MQGKFWIVCGAVLAGIAVAFGALGAHVLKSHHDFTDAQLATFDVGVRYQMYHSLALILVGLLAAQANCRCLKAAGSLFLLGIVLFSGGLYAWLFTEIKPFVHVVPVGGTLWIVAWLVLAWSALRTQSSHHAQ